MARIDPEVLKAIKEKKEQLEINLRDIVTRKSSLQEELTKLNNEEDRLSRMLEALEKEFPKEEPAIA